MTPAAATDPSARSPVDCTPLRPSELSLGELVEVVASLVPEDQVAETVAALFERRLASFARPLDRDEREALRKAA